MSENKKSTAPPTTKRDANGRFVKGNAIGKETRMKPNNDLSEKYKEEYADQLIEYFSSPKPEILYDYQYDSDGTVKSERISQIMPPLLPTIERFAVMIKVSPLTVRHWREEHPRFNSAYIQAMAMQKDLLLSYASSKMYDGNFSKFVLVNNHDMSDQTKNETTFRMVLDADIDEESN